MGGTGLRRAALVALAASLAAGCGGDGEAGPPSRQEARRCLEELGIHVTIDRLPGEPRWELVANDLLQNRVMLYVQYHDDEDAAKRYEPGVRREARRHGWVAERHGTLTFLWRDGHEGRIGRQTRGCVL
jgi:hypothetical protein